MWDFVSREEEEALNEWVDGDGPEPERQTKKSKSNRITIPWQIPECLLIIPC